MYSTGKAAAHLGMTPKTLQRWDPKGRLVRNARDGACIPRQRSTLSCAARRLPLRDAFRCTKPDLEARPGGFCAARGMANVAYVKEAGGGLNLNRPEFVSRCSRRRENARGGRRSCPG
jgi:hypothetical protein